MFIFNWFWNVLNSLGLTYKEAKIVFLGLDNAGKTTLLHMLRDDKLAVHYPTQKPTMEELTMGKIKFRTYDLGGHTQARKVWREYFPDVNAVVYLVDCADPDRFSESKDELDGLLSNEDLSHVPIVVLANKIDKPEAVSESDFRMALGLEQTFGKENFDTTTKVRPVEVFMCSIAQRFGYKEAFNWLSNFI